MSLRGPVLKREGGDFENFASVDADQERSMRKIYITSLALAIAAGFALPLAGSAAAAMGGALPTTGFLPVENAQMVYLGHNFCWYDGGWQGPGFYWCGYAWNNGNGWGGGEGWRGWNHGSPSAHSESGGEAHHAHVDATHPVHTGGAPGHVSHAVSKPAQGHPDDHGSGDHNNKT